MHGCVTQGPGSVRASEASREEPRSTDNTGAVGRVRRRGSQAGHLSQELQAPVRDTRDKAARLMGQGTAKGGADRDNVVGRDDIRASRPL